MSTVLWGKEFDLLKDTVLHAGRAIKKLSSPFADEILYKTKNSPLTVADIKSNQILKEELLSQFPQYGWLSEETQDDGSRLQKKMVWIVDPLDGTKEYINKIPEYAISVALVEYGIPVVAVVFNPASNQFFSAVKGYGAWLNGKRIFCQQENNNINVLASRSEVADGDWLQFDDCFDIIPKGSIAYRLALVAAGQASASFTLESRSEWDIAAGVLLVKEAGGVAVDLSRKDFIFNQENTRVSGVLVSSRNIYPKLIEKINSKLVVVES